MKSLELKVPPLALAALAAALARLVSRLFPALAFDFPARSGLAAFFIAAGALVCASGIASFRRAGTTVNPMKPGSSTSLVSSGIYSRTRNPMYLGFLLILAGWIFFQANFAALLLLPAFIFYMNRFQIAPEERALALLFGEEYARYRARVRRWL